MNFKQQNLKKSSSQRVENIKTAGSMKDEETSQSQHSEASLPDSSRVRRDGRKRMKKTVSSKIYENMQSQDVSKVDDSNVQHIDIDHSMNKNQTSSSYNTIDLMSIHGLSQQNIDNTHTTQPNAQGSIMNGIQSKNMNFSIQQQMINNLNQSQQPVAQSLSQIYESANGAQMPRRLDKNAEVIDLSSNQYEKPSLSKKQILFRGVLGVAFLVYLTFNILMSFETISPENTSLRGSNQKEIQENGDEYYSVRGQGQKKEVEDTYIFKEQLKNCNIKQTDFLNTYRKKESFLDLHACQWIKECNIQQQKVFSRFCVNECPTNYKNVSGTCQTEN